MRLFKWIFMFEIMSLSLTSLLSSISLSFKHNIDSGVFRDEKTRLHWLHKTLLYRISPQKIIYQSFWCKRKKRTNWNFYNDREEGTESSTWNQTEIDNEHLCWEHCTDPHRQQPNWIQYWSQLKLEL